MCALRKFNLLAHSTAQLMFQFGGWERRALRKEVELAMNLELPLLIHDIIGVKYIIVSHGIVFLNSDTFGVGNGKVSF